MKEPIEPLLEAHGWSLVGSDWDGGGVNGKRIQKLNCGDIVKLRMIQDR